MKKDTNTRPPSRLGLLLFERTKTCGVFVECVELIQQRLLHADKLENCCINKRKLFLNNKGLMILDLVMLLLDEHKRDQKFSSKTTEKSTFFRPWSSEKLLR